MTQPGGGRLVGKADATPGYRGMHSFTLNFENYFVPARTSSAASAGSAGASTCRWRGFAAGRLQTGGRACGLAQAALEKTAEYVVDRKQFGTADRRATSSRSTRSAAWRAHARGGARDHLRRGARDGRGRARGGAARRAGEAARLRHRGRGHAGRASCCTAAGATPRSTRSAATSSTRRCCRSSRA